MSLAIGLKRIFYPRVGGAFPIKCEGRNVVIREVLRTGNCLVSLDDYASSPFLAYSDELYAQAVPDLAFIRQHGLNLFRNDGAYRAMLANGCPWYVSSSRSGEVCVWGKDANEAVRVSANGLRAVMREAGSIRENQPEPVNPGFKLLLSNGYPFPHPKNLSLVQEEHFSETAACVTLEIEGIKHFEIKHTVTVEFVDQAAYDKALALTGWSVWSAADLILEARASSADGYGLSCAIIAKQVYEDEALPNGKTESTAFCGYQLYI